MSRETHVRFWESAGVRFPCATQLPLYRQHQRLLAAGIDVSRQWLTQQVLAVALLLAPIVEAQLAAIRACRVKAMAVTPIKAGRTGKGKLKTGYCGPVWGNTAEGGGDIVFLYRPSRAAIHVREGLGEKAGDGAVLVTDGYVAYERYAERLSLIHISEPTRQPATSRMPSSA